MRDLNNSAVRSLYLNFAAARKCKRRYVVFLERLRRERKRRTLARRALDRQLAAHRPREIAADGETEPRALGGAR